MLSVCSLLDGVWWLFLMSKGHGGDWAWQGRGRRNGLSMLSLVMRMWSPLPFPLPMAGLGGPLAGLSGDADLALGSGTATGRMSG